MAKQLKDCVPKAQSQVFIYSLELTKIPFERYIHYRAPGSSNDNSGLPNGRFFTMLFCILSIHLNILYYYAYWATYSLSKII